MLPLLAKMLLPRLSATTVNLCAASFLVLCANNAFWTATASKLKVQGGGNPLFLAALAVTLLALFNIVLSLFSFKPVHKPAIIIFIVTAAVASYFMGTYGTIIDKQMIGAVMETDRREAMELFTWPLMRHLTLMGVLPSLLLLRTRISYLPLRRELLLRLGTIAGSTLLVSGTVLANYKTLAIFGRANRDLRMYINPSYPIYSFTKALQRGEKGQKHGPLKQVAQDARKVGEEIRRVVVLVVGETARAENFPANGYGRNTTPELGEREVFNFSDVHSCGTETAVSLPCMFSPFGKGDYSPGKASSSENLLDVLQRTGVQVLWRDNNSGSKGVADRVAYEDVSNARDRLLCPSGACYDEILLKDLEKAVAKAKGDLLIVLHQKGSHGPSYYKRTPASFKKFTPECTVDNIQDCAPHEIVNAYDNTIVYTDHFLAGVIDLLRASHLPTAMLYVSDHGESLGENNIYLHGLPYAIAPDEQSHVPMIFWASAAFMKAGHLDPELLKQQESARLSHDNLFHTMLGLFNVRTRFYREDLDMLFAARGSSVHTAGGTREKPPTSLARAPRKVI